jgi:site-specific recombinase XerD
MTLRRLIHRYLEHLRDERNASPETVRAYEGDLLRFHDFLARELVEREGADIAPT